MCVSVVHRCAFDFGRHDMSVHTYAVDVVTDLEPSMRGFGQHAVFSNIPKYQYCNNAVVAYEYWARQCRYARLQKSTTVIRMLRNGIAVHWYP
jgi:hypothetical protein